MRSTRYVLLSGSCEQYSYSVGDTGRAAGRKIREIYGLPTNRPDLYRMRRVHLQNNRGFRYARYELIERSRKVGSRQVQTTVRARFAVLHHYD